MYSAVLFIFLAISSRHLLVFAQGCRTESGKEIVEGGRVKTANPCLECFCGNGKIQCRLKICPPLPRPPPESCVLLQKPNSCCGKLLCPGKHNEKARSNIETKLEHDSEGCMFNGTLYAEGSAMMSSLCEYCYCIKGKQHCVRPQCTLSVAGCKPEYNKHSCCPTKYNCSDLNAVSSTTTLPSSTASSEGCWSDGVKYPEGERVQSIEKACENCYCMKGKVRCDPIICNMTHLNHCTPIHNQGHCCPISYNCSTNLETNGTSTESSETTTFIETTSTEFSESTTPFSLAETTTFEPFNDTELRSGDDQYERETTTEFFTTLAMTTLKNPTRPIPAVIEAILNRTLEREGDYGEYDYNEPSLPPSLPNLKIIPFVAADAVINGNEGSELFEQNETKFKTTEEPIYYELPKDSKFSPPSETEGGFLPRDPNIDGPFYESKIVPNSGDPETTSEVKFPPLTEAPKLFENGQCKTKGVTYHHGEVVSEPKACELCVCYFGKIHCQKAKCDNASECHKDSCCQCDTSKVTSPTYIPESLSNLPAITIADVIVTPDPFKDVIRTEPAPDLEHILKDMMPHIEKNKNEVEKIKSEPEKSNGTEKAKNVTTPMPETTTDYDELSFGSVFDLLFNDETKKPSIFDESNPETNLVVHADERVDHFKPNSSDKYDIKYNTTDKTENSDNSIKGLLKLAGCNIYGRMYRVEKIIAELSNACLECKCTEMGVQCKKLNC